MKKKLILIFSMLAVVIYVSLLTIGTPRATNTDKTKQSLTEFLKNDQTDKHPYILNEYTCYNYSKDLQKNAALQGFKCHVVYIGSPTVEHVVVCFELCDGVVFVEPQLDTVLDIFSEYPNYVYITIWN